MDSQPANTLVVTCGPEIMMRFVVKGLMERGFEASQIYVSLERRMNCGISKCGKCQLGPKYVCRDGPVFAFAELTLLPEPVLV
ncbi:MAG: Ni/Fe hydrogenase subunit gamma, partial [Clostridia bacterium]|nr:Ni/Fe hydrogenase subunit gamma [Clostridia bacterium]